MKPIEDPLWDEEEQLREEYIKIHGERVYDDDEDDLKVSYDTSLINTEDHHAKPVFQLYIMKTLRKFKVFC